MNTMKKGIIGLTGLVLCFGFTGAMAGEGHGAQAKGGHGGGHEMGAKGGHKKGHKKAKKMGGTFTPHWVKTLSDEQKMSFDKMHLQVGQYAVVQKAKIKVLKAELNVMAAKNANNKSAIYGKIDEILEAKKGIMRNRFDHIAEMRAELTDQQRISYDMGLLKRGKKH